MLGRIRGEVRFKERLAHHTSLRCGGLADFLVVPQDIDDLREALAFADREGLPLVTLGRGTGLLIRDQGVRGVVVKLDGCLSRMEFHGDEVTVGAGAGVLTVIREGARLGLGGLESLTGVPGTIGGALAGNAGTPDGRIGDFVLAVYFLHADGTIGEFKPQPVVFDYAAFAPPPGSIMLGARLMLRRKARASIDAEIAKRLTGVRATYPMALPLAGFVWRDPPGDTASRLVAAARMKGKRLGGAEISAKHPNILVNRGGATAREALDLIQLVAEAVHRKTGVRLEQRLRVVGD
jgi:UDP-N-acetylmuramate dehydrogenase